MEDQCICAWFDCSGSALSWEGVVADGGNATVEGLVENVAKGTEEVADVIQDTISEVIGPTLKF